MSQLVDKSISHFVGSMVYFTQEVDPSFAEPPMNFNGGLGKFDLTCLVM